MIYKTLYRKLKIEQHKLNKKTDGELRCSGRVGSSYSTCGTRHVTLVTKKGKKSWMRKGPDCDYDNQNNYPWSFVTQTSRNGYSGEFNLTTLFSSFPVGSSNLSRKSWQEPQAMNIESTERYILNMQVLLGCCFIKMESSQWENWNRIFLGLMVKFRS